MIVTIVLMKFQKILYKRNIFVKIFYDQRSNVFVNQYKRLFYLGKLQ